MITAAKMRSIAGRCASDRRCEQTFGDCQNRSWWVARVMARGRRGVPGRVDSPRGKAVAGERETSLSHT
jgi:hypothetical protein